MDDEADRALRTAQQLADDVREQIRLARKAEAAARAEAEKWERALAIMEQDIGEHIEATEVMKSDARERAGLTTGSKRIILDSKMQIDTSGHSKNVRIAAGRTRKESEPRRLLLTAGETAATVAKHLKVTPAAVNHWLVGRNAIPLRHAQEMRRWRNIPLAVWPKLGE